MRSTGLFKVPRFWVFGNNLGASDGEVRPALRTSAQSC